MKRMKKALIGLAVGAIAALGVVGFAACGDKTVSGTAEGEYHYANHWSPDAAHYGVKVKVTVEDDIIQSLEIVESNYVQATVGWEGREDYLAHESEILAKFKGLDVDDIMKLEIAVDDNGQPITSKNEAKVARIRSNFELVRRKLVEVEAKDAVRNFRNPIDGEYVMKVYGIGPERRIGLLKDMVKEAILDGVIGNNFDEADAYMRSKAPELGLHEV